MRALVITSVLLFLTLSRTALAEETNYQPYPMGERALGMGGAATAITGYPISSYYNPAGLVSGQTTSLSTNLNVYGSVKRTVDDGGFYLAWEPDPDNPELLRPRLADLEYEEFPPATVPISSVIVQRLGKRLQDRTRPHAIAWSTLIPRAYDLSYSLSILNEFSPDAPADEHRLSFRESDKLMYIGASYAYRLAPRFSIGISIFCAIRTFTHSFHHTFFNTDPSSDYAGIQVREIDIDSTVYSGVIRLGGIWHLAPRWNLGMMVSLPSFEIYGEGSYSFRDVETFTDGYTLIENNKARPHDRIPLEVRAGVSYEVPDSHALALDVSLYAPSSFDRFEVPPGWYGHYYVHHVERGFIANVNLGGELIIADNWPMRIGFFTDLSSAPEVVASDIPQLPRIHNFGGTLSVGFTRNNFDINIGVLASIGSGQAHTIGPQGLEDSPTYVPTPVRERRIYVVISGAQRALGRVVNRVIDRIGDRQEEGESE